MTLAGDHSFVAIEPCSCVREVRLLSPIDQTKRFAPKSKESASQPRAFLAMITRSRSSAQVSHVIGLQTSVATLSLTSSCRLGGTASFTDPNLRASVPHVDSVPGPPVY